jgi:hypothetical protein
MSLQEKKTDLEVSLHKMLSLKDMMSLPGWELIGEHFDSRKELCQQVLDDPAVKDIADIQAMRALKSFIEDFYVMVINTTTIKLSDAKKELDLINQRINENIKQ